MKTINDALNEGYEHAAKPSSYVDGFMDCAEFVQRWIPIEEELPESDDILTTVIVKLNGAVVNEFIGYEIMNYDRRDKKFHYRGSSKTNARVTHYRYIEYK